MSGEEALFTELLSLGNESGAKSIILQDSERVARFVFPEGAIDIDTCEDWEKLDGESSWPKANG